MVRPAFIALIDLSTIVVIDKIGVCIDIEVPNFQSVETDLFAFNIICGQCVNIVAVCNAVTTRIRCAVKVGVNPFSIIKNTFYPMYRIAIIVVFYDII